ncbi:MAG: hypothetical protein HOO94_00590 [Novosphingobium sp.]|nr:hypothetical protein [Novosphingobium sp.]
MPPGSGAPVSAAGPPGTPVGRAGPAEGVVTGIGGGANPGRTEEVAAGRRGGVVAPGRGEAITGMLPGAGDEAAPDAGAAEGSALGAADG